MECLRCIAFCCLQKLYEYKNVWVGKLICPFKIARKKISLWYLWVNDDEMIFCNGVLRQTHQLQKLRDLEIYLSI